MAQLLYITMPDTTKPARASVGGMRVSGEREGGKENEKERKCV